MLGMVQQTKAIERPCRAVREYNTACAGISGNLTLWLFAESGPAPAGAVRKP